jgi:hypothetical protein
MIFRIPVSARKIAFTASLVLISNLQSPSASAALPIVGWGYSLGNWVSGQSDDPQNPYIITEGWDGC